MQKIKFVNKNYTMPLFFFVILPPNYYSYFFSGGYFSPKKRANLLCYYSNVNNYPFIIYPVKLNIYLLKIIQYLTFNFNINI